MRLSKLFWDNLPGLRVKMSNSDRIWIFRLKVRSRGLTEEDEKKVVVDVELSRSVEY